MLRARVDQARSHLFVREDLDVASTNGPELVPGHGARFQGVEVLKVLGDGVVMGVHGFVEPGQGPLARHFLWRLWWRASGHFLGPLRGSLGKENGK